MALNPNTNANTHKQPRQTLFFILYVSRLRAHYSCAFLTITSVTTHGSFGCDSPARNLTNRPLLGRRAIGITTFFGSSSAARIVSPAARRVATVFQLTSSTDVSTVRCRG